MKYQVPPPPPRDFTWSFMVTPRREITPIDNSDDPLIVQRNWRGGWGLRFHNESESSIILDFPTCRAAEAFARQHVTNVCVVQFSSFCPSPTTKIT